MKKFQALRLVKLGEFLSKLPSHLFNIYTFGSYDYNKPSECGTAICAGGWACTIPSFRKAGLRKDYGTPRTQNNGDLETFFGIDGIFYNMGLNTPKIFRKEIIHKLKDYKKGYTKNNVVFVHKDVNIMKNVYKAERFIEVCIKTSINLKDK